MHSHEENSLLHAVLSGASFILRKNLIDQNQV